MSNLTVEEKIDPRIKRTRALIETAFIEVMMEKGFQATTVQDVADRAGINRTTFYLHFPDKYALLNYTMRQMFLQELEKRVLNRHEFTPENLKALIALVAEFIVTANSHCASLEEQFEALVEAQVKTQIQDVLAGWGAQAGLPGNFKHAAIAGSWALYGLALEWGHARKRSSVEDFTDQTFPLIYEILSSSAG